MKLKKIKVLGKISDKLKNEIIVSKELSLTFEETTGFWLDYANSTFELGTLFKQMQFDSNLYEIRGVLCFVTDGTFLIFSSIEEGYKTIAFIKFDKILPIFNEIPIIENWYSDKKDDREIFLISY